MPYSTWGQVNPWLFLPPGWDTRWKAAKGGAGSAVYSVNVIGDSTTECDNNATDVMTKSWWRLVRDSLAARYPVSGDYYSPAYSAQWYTTHMGFGAFPGTPPYVFTTTSGEVWNPTMFGQSVYWGAASPVITFNTPANLGGTDLDVVVMNYNTPTWTYKVDAATAVTVTPPSSGVVDPPIQRIAMLTNGSAGAHSVIYTGSSSVEPMHMGTIVYPTNAGRSRGLGFVWGAVTGLQLGSYLIPNNGLVMYPSNPSLLLQGASAGSGTAQPEFPAKPSLMFIALGINDCQTQPTQINTALGPDGFIRGLSKVIEACRYGNQDASIVIVGMSMPGDSPMGPITSGNYIYWRNWSFYLNAMQEAAGAYSCAFVNIHAAWGQTGVARGFQTAGDPHPTDAGYADIAARINAFL